MHSMTALPPLPDFSASLGQTPSRSCAVGFFSQAGDTSCAFDEPAQSASPAAAATAIMFASAIVLPPTAAFWIRIVSASYFVSPTWVSA